jgi:IS30 family transposase
MSEERIMEIQNILNYRPRKRYNYENPINCCGKIIV